MRASVLIVLRQGEPGKRRLHSEADELRWAMGPESPDPQRGKFSEADIEVDLRPVAMPGFAAVVTLRGEHDLATGYSLLQAIEPIFGDVLVDLSDCTFIDSTVISVLINASRTRTEEGQRLEVLVPAENTLIMRTLTVAGVTHILRVRTSRP